MSALAPRMSADNEDYLTDLTTSPIFDDSLFRLEALGLTECRDEDELDDLLAVAARESGIQNPYTYLCPPEPRDISTAMSSVTLSSEQRSRSSMSIRSKESQSTGITSHPSRTSKDIACAEQQPVSRTPPPLIRTSLSMDHYDTVMDRFRPGIKHRHSASAASGANSVLSVASSSLKPSPTLRKHRRASKLFSKFRRDHGTSQHQSPRNHCENPSQPKLDCGHTLTKYAIRVQIQDALNSNEHLIPACCGKPLPRSVLETVLTKEETDIVLTDILHPSTASSQRDSGYGEDNVTELGLPRSPEPQSHDAESHDAESYVAAPDAANRDITKGEETACLSSALANEAFKALRAQQEEEIRRIVSFETNQRKALSAYRHWALRRLKRRLEVEKEDRIKEHARALERLDDNQISAEHELRKAQAQETQNVATALKYMEAYCSGVCTSSPDSPTTPHDVTDEDRKKLAIQHMTQEKLPAKHESAINVLRARQERNLMNRLERQVNEMEQLDIDYDKERMEMENQLTKDSSKLESLIQQRRKRIANRWVLKTEMWRKDWETQHNTTLNSPLPHEEWPSEVPNEGPIDPMSSLALYHVQS